MKRRRFIKGAAGGAVTAAAAAASSLPAPAIAQGIRELKMVTTWPKNFLASARPPSASPNASQRPAKGN